MSETEQKHTVWEFLICPGDTRREHTFNLPVGSVPMHVIRCVEDCYDQLAKMYVFVPWDEKAVGSEDRRFVSYPTHAVITEASLKYIGSWHGKNGETQRGNHLFEILKT